MISIIQTSLVNEGDLKMFQVMCMMCLITVFKTLDVSQSQVKAVTESYFTQTVAQRALLTRKNFIFRINFFFTSILSKVHIHRIKIVCTSLSIIYFLGTLKVQHRIHINYLDDFQSQKQTLCSNRADAVFGKFV